MAQILPFLSEDRDTVRTVSAPPPKLRLGDALVFAGALSAGERDDALVLQRTQDASLGQILLAERRISRDDLTQALARQSDLGMVDLDHMPADPELLEGLDPYACLMLEAVPWRQVGGTRVIAISNPANADAALALCGGEAAKHALAISTPAAIRRTITEGFKGQLRTDARGRCPERFSCRNWSLGSRPRRLALGAAVLLTAVAAMPLLALQLLMGWIMLVNAMTMGLRLVALFARFRPQAQAPAPDPALPRLADYKKLPRVSVLVPLLREEAVAKQLLDALAAMDYPAALLDIKLVLEEDDAVTRAAIDKAELPPTIEVIMVPRDGLKTKPRAMNYALPFCRGDIVGVYDAEDRPDPAQIRAVVQHLQDAPPEVACVQGYLDFYNTQRNWLSRCFTLEYAIWFRVILKGVERLRIPIPLGGTTVFFRRNVLEEIGAWDAHNVTEDADLGMRLARFGYRCEMIATTTLEEANFRVLPWIRQRSRWLKGYAITWATHMRNPRQLLADLGLRGFLGFQVLFLGAITSYLSIPLFWAVWLGAAGFDLAFWQTFPDWLRWGFIGSMSLGQGIMLAVAFVAARDTGRRGLLPWILVLPLYWPMGAVAAYRAIAEVFYAPFYWHKTEHGVPEPEA